MISLQLIASDNRRQQCLKTVEDLCNREQGCVLSSFVWEQIDDSNQTIMFGVEPRTLETKISEYAKSAFDHVSGIKVVTAAAYAIREYAALEGELRAAGFNEVDDGDYPVNDF